MLASFLFFRQDGFYSEVRVFVLTLISVFVFTLLVKIKFKDVRCLQKGV